VWVAPFYEDDIHLLAETIGVERLMFGSDYPHAEGLEIPTAFIDDLHGFSPTDIEKIMRHNVIDFLGL
jgi:predicted TIM-barrel fold metal-dependent hydrolase